MSETTIHTGRFEYVAVELRQILHDLDGATWRVARGQLQLLTERLEALATKPTTGAYADALTADQQARTHALTTAARIALAGGRSSDVDDVLDLADHIADWIRTGTRTALTDDPTVAYQAGWEEACELIGQKLDQAATDLEAAADAQTHPNVAGVATLLIERADTMRQAARAARGTNPAPANPAPPSSTPAAAAPAVSDVA